MVTRIRLGSLLLLAIFIFSAPRVAAQKLYFFSVINTDNFYRPDRQVDAENINRMAGNISKYLNMEKYTYDFGDSVNFNPETVKRTLKSIPVVPCSNDIVWFHYSGNGGNYGGGPVPALQLFGGNLEVSDVKKIIAEKNPKLLLITIDAPNKSASSERMSGKYLSLSKIPGALSPRVSFISSDEIPYYLVLENYDALFRNFDNSRVIVITSSSRGEDALSDRYKGSYWVQAFSRAIDETVNGKTGKDIWVENVSVRLDKHLSRLSKNMQHSRISVISSSIICDEE